MSSSLRDQLIAAGLVSQKQVREATPTKRPPQQSKKLPPPLSAAELASQRAQAEKFARDQALNRKRQEKAERKARRIQIEQMIEQAALPRAESEEFYNFVDGGKIKRMAVMAETRARIQTGDVVIVRSGPGYRLVPVAAAAKIRERDPSVLVAAALVAEAARSIEDDPYRQFVVPDDLKW
jgi:uncharacterized protein